MVSSQVIPGLPNDLALQCLLCMPAKELVSMQTVSPLWRIVIQSDRFYMERRRRQPYPSIFVIRRVHDGYQCLDAGMEDLQNPRLLFSCDLCEGKKLFPPDVVFACVKANVYSVAPGHQVQKFSLLTRRWTPVSKLFPHKCKLMVSALGRHVVVVSGANVHPRDITSDDEDDNDEASYTVCQILDTHTHQWACIEGLPKFFYGSHCFAYEGAFHALGVAKDGSPVDYKLNWTKRQWEEDVYMSTLLQSFIEKDKIIVRPRTLLAATTIGETVNVQTFSLDSRTWIDVVRYNISRSKSSFLFRQDEKIFLAVLSEASSWKIMPIFYYHGLKILSVPGDELLMVDAITG